MAQRNHTVLFSTGTHKGHSAAPFVSPNRAGRFDRKMLSPRDHKILQLVALGYTGKEIAEHLGISQGTVSAVRNSPIGRDHLDLLLAVKEQKSRDIVRELQERVLPAAFDKLEKLVIDGEHTNSMLTPKDAAREYREIMALAGIVKPTKVQISGSVTHLTSDDFEEIRRRATVAAKECGIQLSITEGRSTEEIIDAPFTELLGESLEEIKDTLHSAGNVASVSEDEAKEQSPMAGE